MENNLKFRKQLQDITDNFIGDRASEQLKLIESLKNEGYEHSISLHQEAIVGHPETFRFNCYQFALDLVGVTEVENIAIRYEKIFPNSEYISFLMQTRKLQEINNGDVNSGLIVYFEDKLPKHIGKIFEGRVCSKWGLCHTLEHGVFEVPISYGNEVRIYEGISRESAISSFLEFANTEIRRVGRFSKRMLHNVKVAERFL